MNRPTLPNLPCICASLRRATRALTQSYEQALRPFGLRSTQFTILQVLARAGEVSQGQLGEMLAMDVTTLTRTLEIMRRHGWIAERRGKDRRWRLWRISKRGQTRLQLAEPAWERLQSGLRRQLGNERWDHLLQLTDQVMNFVESHQVDSQGDDL